MRHLPILLAVALAACTSHDTTGPGDEAFVLPGTFSEETTVDDLKSRFGAANVRAVEDGDEPGIVLFPDDPTRRAWVTFHESESNPFDIFASITVRDPESRWRGKHGIRIGTTFAELEALNETSFFFAGFDDSGAGSVRDWWNAGKLDVGDGQRLYFGVDLRLRPQAEKLPAGAYPRGEVQTESTDERFPRLGEVAEVSALTAWSSLDDEWS